MLVKQYKVYKSGELIGTYAAKEIEKIIGCNKNSVPRYADTGNPYNGTYIFKYIGECDGNKIFDTYTDDWNKIRECAKLIASGQAVIRQIGNEKFTCRRVKK